MTDSPIIVRATCTPILIGDPPLLNVVGVHQPFNPRAVIELETDTGVTGIGETYGDTDYLRIAQVVADRIIGRPLAAINMLYGLVREWAQVGSSQHRERDPARLRGTGSDEKLIRSVFSAYEVASLDALGKVLDLPVHALLGGKVRDRVDYSAYLFYRWAEHPLPQPDGAPADLPRDSWGAALDPEASFDKRNGSSISTASGRSNSREVSSRPMRRSPRSRHSQRRSPAARYGWIPTPAGRYRRACVSRANSKVSSSTSRTPRRRWPGCRRCTG